MESKTKELVKAGHELVVLLGTQHGMLDAASLVQRLTAQLDITAIVLREKSKQCDQLAAENAALKMKGQEVLKEAAYVYSHYNRMVEHLDGESVDGQTLHEFQCVIETDNDCERYHHAHQAPINVKELRDVIRELLERRERDKQEPEAQIYAELHRLREEARGPDGFSTWKDAAMAERLARVKCETLLNQRSYDIDYLTAMAAFHSDDWHKMSPIKAYMHGWNARSTDAAAERDARRYRFLRDKDAFGADNEPGLVSWDDLTELDLCEFDAAVDARLVAALNQTHIKQPASDEAQP